MNKVYELVVVVVVVVGSPSSGPTLHELELALLFLFLGLVLVEGGALGCFGLDRVTHHVPVGTSLGGGCLRAFRPGPRLGASVRSLRPIVTPVADLGERTVLECGWRVARVHTRPGCRTRD